MSTEARELHRIIRASVRDMLDAYRIQALVKLADELATTQTTPRDVMHTG